MIWALFYADSSRPEGFRMVTSAAMDPQDVPKEGLVYAAHPKHFNGNNAFPADWFMYRNGRWWPHDQQACFRIFINSPDEVVCLRQGEMVSEELFERIVKEAHRPEIFAWAHPQ